MTERFIGQEASEKTLRAVSQAVGNHIEPKIHPRIEKLMTEDGKPYIKVQFSGSRQPYSCDGRYRIRSADEDSPMRSAEPTVAAVKAVHPYEEPVINVIPLYQTGL